MPRGLYNWTFKDIINFLKENGFRYSHTEGSHFFYVKRKAGEKYQVCVSFHGSKVIKPRTVKGIIRQSGISQKEWIKKK